MPQNFNIEEARKHYNDEEILMHLVDRHEVGGKRFDVEGAMKQGYNTQELIEHLSSVRFPEKLESNIPKWGQEHPKLYKAKEAVQSVAPSIAEGTGAGLGAAYGSALGPWGMLAGGTLGFAISKGTMRQVDKQIEKLERGGTKRTSVQDEMLQSLYDLREGATYEMFGQGLGKALPKAAELISAPFHKRMTPEAKFVLQEANKRGIDLTPYEVVDAKSLGLAEELLEKIWGASDVINDFRMKSQIEPLQRQLKSLLTEGSSKESIESVGQKIWDEVTDYLVTEKRLEGKLLEGVRTKLIAKFGSNQSFHGLGLETKELLKARVALLRDRKNELYNAISEVMPKGGFKASNLADVAKKILKGRKELPGYGLDKDMVVWLKWAAKTQDLPPDLKKALANAPAKVRESILKDIGDEFDVKRNWETLQTFKRDMESVAGKEDPMRYTGLKGQITEKGTIALKLKQAALKDMRVAAEGSPQALERLNIADAFYGDYARVVKSKMVRNLINTDAGKVLDVAFKPNAIEEIKLIKEAVGPNGFLKLREGFAKKLIGADKHEIFKPDFFKGNITRYGDETLGEIFGKSNVKQMRKIAEEGLDLTVHKPGRNFLKSMTELDPDYIVDRIIGAPESKIGSAILGHNLTRIQRVISKKTFSELGDKLSEKLFTLNQTTGLVKPISFTKMVDKYDRVLRKFYPYEKVNELRTLANIGRRLQKAEQVAGNPSGTGQTLIAWGMFRMIMNGIKKGTTWAIAFTPKQLAKIYRSKFGMKWLTEGFKLPAGSKKAAVYFSRLSAIIADDQIEDKSMEE
jgi:hypothetical protein